MSTAHWIKARLISFSCAMTHTPSTNIDGEKEMRGVCECVSSRECERLFYQQKSGEKFIGKKHSFHTANVLNFIPLSRCTN